MMQQIHLHPHEVQAITRGRQIHLLRPFSPQPPATAQSWLLAADDTHDVKFFKNVIPNAVGMAVSGWLRQPIGRPGAVFMGLGPSAAIRLAVTAVTVRRVQHMSFNEWLRDFAVTWHDERMARASFTGAEYQVTYSRWFWDALYPEFTWDSNPWIVDTQVERVKHG